MFKNKLFTKFILFLIICLSLFFNLYKKDVSPPGFNADEASFSYNAYSIAQTGKDEYGAFLPLRLKSFGDYKLPLYTYLTVPLVKIFGLSEITSRLLNTILAVFFPLIIFLLGEELFANKKISLLASFFTAASLGLNIVGRHTHEAYLASFLVTFLLLFFIKLLKKNSWQNQLVFFVALLLSLFAYHSNRIFAGVFFLFSLYYVFVAKKLKVSFIFIFSLILGGFLLTDVIYSPARVSNLLFFKDPGFVMRINELKGEGQAFLFNKLTIGTKEIIDDYLTYFSPQFLAINVLNSDTNYRFGFPGMGYINVIEYLGLFIGGYYLFKNKEKWKWLLILFFLSAPITAALAWQKSAMTRSFFMFIPLYIIAAYGIINFIKNIYKEKYFVPLMLFLSCCYLLFFTYNWTFYFFHYPKRALVINSWQPGYAELGDYIKKNYDRFDNFYITKDNGMPYIFLLFYLKYPPEKYQQQAALTSPDKYGFGQVEKFDKFIFHFVHQPSQVKKSVLIGSPADFKNITENIDHSKVITIKRNSEEIFKIYEVN